MVHALLCILLGSACSPAAPVTIDAQAWPEADLLFEQDPRWLGADVAYSVPLGGERVLWLFGDTFVANSSAHVRSESRMVRNTVAIQRGLDPTTAAISFFWQDKGGELSAFFPSSADAWYWPMHGIVVNDVLLIALVRVVESPGAGLGFKVDGWRLVRIDNPQEAPDAWRPEWIVPTPHPAEVIPGLAFHRQGDYIVSAALQQPGTHSGHLVRWSVEDFSNGDLEQAQWWYGNGSGWSSMTSELPEIILADGGTEASIHFDSGLEQFVYVRSNGFGASTLVAHFAGEIEGPWSRALEFYVPPEGARDDAFIYAGKGHPELIGADLVVTYVVNTFADFSQLVDDTSIYYPRFVKLEITPL